MNHTTPTGTEAGFDLDKLEAMLNELIESATENGFNMREALPDGAPPEPSSNVKVLRDKLIALARRAALAPADSVLKGHWEPMGKFARRFVPDAPDTTASASIADRAEQAAILGSENQCRDALLEIAKDSRAAQPVQAGEAVDERKVFTMAEAFSVFQDLTGAMDAIAKGNTDSEEIARIMLRKTDALHPRFLAAYRASLAPVSAQQGAADERAQELANVIDYLVANGHMRWDGFDDDEPFSSNNAEFQAILSLVKAALPYRGAAKAPAEGSPQDNCTDCGGSRAHKGDKARDCESCDGTGRGWVQRENVVKAPASGYVHPAGEDVLGGAKRIAENVRHWAPAAQAVDADKLAEKLTNAAIAVGHIITDESVVLHRNPQRAGNALKQLEDRLKWSLPRAASPASTPEAAPLPLRLRALREVTKQKADPKLATPGATAYASFLYAELERLQSAVIADAAQIAALPSRTAVEWGVPFGVLTPEYKAEQAAKNARARAALEQLAVDESEGGHHD
jgi:hypothetical protein